MKCHDCTNTAYYKIDGDGYYCYPHGLTYRPEKRATLIPVIAYYKVDWDSLDQAEWLFAVQNAVLIDGEAYLSKRASI